MCSVCLLQGFGRKERKTLPICGKDKSASLGVWWAAALLSNQGCEALISSVLFVALGPLDYKELFSNNVLVMTLGLVNRRKQECFYWYI